MRSVFSLKAKIIFLETFRQYKEPDYVWNFSKNISGHMANMGIICSKNYVTFNLNISSKDLF